MFGGTTLVIAYALGAGALRVDVAPKLLIALGLLQVVCGGLWVARPRLLRGWVLRRPGTLVGLALAASTVVIVFGGSGPGRAYITSAQCWLILAGLALPGRRWVVALIVMACVVAPSWALIDGADGGFDEDGTYLTTYIAFAASVAAGLWMGRVTGSAASTLNRWHLVEIHELGVVDRLRAGLGEVRRCANRLAAALHAERVERSTELSLLQDRLEQEANLGESSGQQTTELETLVERLRREQADDLPRLDVDLNAEAGRLALGPVVADAVLSVVRRQLDNVVRHAPTATVIHLTGRQHRSVIQLRIEDDGGGVLPSRAGVGTAWSRRQLARVGGSAAYFAGERGVGLEVKVPASAEPTVAESGRLSVRRELERFGFGIVDAVRLAGYVGDTLTATSVSDSFGPAWIVMPVGALLIEAVIRAGRAHVGPLTPSNGVLIASVLSALVAAAFAWLPGGGDTIVPATTSVMVPALALLTGGVRAWSLAEAMRWVAVAPLFLADPAAGLGLLVVYPLGMYLLVRAIRRFTERAGGLETRAADALGRAGLAAAVVRGLSLQHDAVDVLARNPTGAETNRAARDLEHALGALDAAARSSLDPREIIVAGLSAALGGSAVEHERGGQRSVAAGAVDRITLFELAALAADERASCAPPGMLGRRRLVRVEPHWSGTGGGDLVLTLVARPSLHPPKRDRVRELSIVAEALGIGVRSTPDALTLSYARS